MCVTISLVTRPSLKTMFDPAKAGRSRRRFSTWFALQDWLVLIARFALCSNLWQVSEALVED